MRQLLRVVTVFLLLIIGIQFGSQKAQASTSPGQALMTVGIAAASGAVLGFSTISFYSEPSKHMGNVLIGAGLGVIVGVGVAAYMIGNEDQEDEIDPEELLVTPVIKKGDGKNKDDSEEKSEKKEKPKKSSDDEEGAMRTTRRKILLSSTRHSVPVITVRNEWAVAMNVLELRF